MTTTMTRQANELLALFPADWAGASVSLTADVQPVFGPSFWMAVHDVGVGETPATALDGIAAGDLAVNGVDVDAMATIIVDLLAVPCDQRWVHLAAQGYSDGELHILSAVMDEWMPAGFAAQMVKMAVDGEYDSPVGLMKNWLGITQIPRLADIIKRHRFSQAYLAICYALIEAMDTAQAAIRIAAMRREVAGLSPEEWITGDPGDAVAICTGKADSFLDGDHSAVVCCRKVVTLSQCGTTR